MRACNKLVSALVKRPDIDRIQLPLPGHGLGKMVHCVVVYGAQSAFDGDVDYRDRKGMPGANGVRHVDRLPVLELRFLEPVQRPGEFRDAGHEVLRSFSWVGQ